MLTAGEQHAATLARTVEELPYLAGNVMHDLHIAVLMREHGFQRIFTRDGHFAKFKFLTVLDPLAVQP